VIYPVCLGRKPPSCADVNFNTTTGWLPSGCGAAVNFDECINSTPVFYLTQNAVPGGVYSTTFTLFPNATQTLTRAWLTPNVRPEDPSPAVFSPGDVTVRLEGPGVETAAGEARQAWVVTVTWTPTAASQIPLGGGGLQLCIQDRRALAYNPYPFASVWLKGTAAAPPLTSVLPATAAAAPQTRAAQRLARRRRERAGRAAGGGASEMKASAAAGVRQVVDAATTAETHKEFSSLIISAIETMARYVADSRAHAHGRPARAPAAVPAAAAAPSVVQHEHVVRVLSTVGNLISSSSGSTRPSY